MVGAMLLPEAARSAASHSNNLIYAKIVMPEPDPVNGGRTGGLAAYAPQAAHSLVEYDKIVR